jgi:tRNA1Val (adenine37-N6)-methyltransferase
MPNSYFQFKQFTIFQDRCAMKVGTDGVLLGAWADTKGVKKALDIGTGTGLIALMLAQRSDAVIDAIEIDDEAATQAGENVAKSPWLSRINVIYASLQDYTPSETKYDLIVSNPPYFTDSLQAPDRKRSVARHNEQLSPDELIEAVNKILDAKGRFCVILPVNEFEIFKILAEKSGLFENRRTLIIPSPDKPVKRVLCELSFNKSDVIVNSMVIEKYGRHRYSEEYIALTKNYYLKF